jgi:hypothetical protein
MRGTLMDAHTELVNVGYYKGICDDAYESWKRVMGDYPTALQQQAIAHGVHTTLALAALGEAR